MGMGSFPLLLTLVITLLFTFFSNSASLISSRKGNALKQFGKSNSLISSVLPIFDIRGGAVGSSKKAKTKSSNRTSQPKSKSSRDDEDDFGSGGDDDDDDDEDGGNRFSSKKRTSSKRKSSRSIINSKSKSKGGKNTSNNSRGRKGKKNKGFELVQWGEKGTKTLGLGIGAVKNRLEELSKQGQSAYKDVYRRAKVMRSSAFEGLLLKATWPGDEAVPREILDEIIKHSIPAFKYGRASAEDDPYHMTMHKLWTKMCEKDWRTVTKSLYILHCISRESSNDACQRFAMAIRSMSRTRNPKNPDHRYFDTREVSELDEKSAGYEDFITAYATYVFYRAKIFSGKFSEIKDISETTHEKQVVARLKKAQQIIKHGLNCMVSSKDQQNSITGFACRLVANDLKDLWAIFSSKISPLLDQTKPYEGTKADEKDVLSLIQFYKETDKELVLYFAKGAKSFSSLRIKFPVEVETKKVTDEQLESRIADLTKISGGAIKMMTADRVAMTLEQREAESEAEDDDEESGEAEDEDEDEDNEEDKDEDDEESSAEDDEDDEEKAIDDDDEEEDEERDDEDEKEEEEENNDDQDEGSDDDDDDDDDETEDNDDDEESDDDE